MVWQGNRDASRGDAGDPRCLSRCHRDIGILLNFQKDLGIVTFWSIELPVPIEVSKGCESSCRDEAGT